MEDIENTEIVSTEAEKQSIGQKLLEKYSRWEDALRPIKEGWLPWLRAYHKIDETQNRPGSETGKTADAWKKSDVYVGLTRTKVMAAYSRLLEIEFPGGKRKNWGVTVSPEPSLALPPEKQVPNPFTPELLERLMQMPEQEAQQAKKQINTKWHDDRDKAIYKEAVERAKRMERKIDDQLTEQRYDISSREALLESTIIGTGCIKGPTVGIKRSRRWDFVNEGGWVSNEYDEVVPNVEACTMFDLTWDADATSPADMSGIFQDHIMNRSDFRALGDLEGFDDGKIAKIIRDNPTGNHTRKSIEIELKSIAKTDSAQTTERFDVKEYWGIVDGMDLWEAGVGDLPEDYEWLEFDANIWFCEEEVIYVKLNPNLSKVVPYKIFPFEKSPNQLCGCGVPEMMADSQYITNKTTRAMLDNQDLSSGPIAEINDDIIDPRKPLAAHIDPWTIYHRSGGDASNPLLRFYEIPNITNQCLAVLAHTRRNVDDETSLPSYTHGEGQPGGSGITRTSSGMSMLMGAANIILKSVAKNGDDYRVAPLIQDIYDFNMQWSDDDRIKGDMQIEAKGVASLIAKEIQQQSVLMWLQTTANPLDQPLTKRANMLRKAAEQFDFPADDAVKSDEEIMAEQKAQQNNPEFRLQQAMMESQIQETMSRTELNKRKSDEIIDDTSLTGPERIAKLDKVQKEIELDHAKIDQIYAGIEYDQNQLLLEGVQTITDVQHKDSENKKQAGKQDNLRSTN